ncbi:MAG: 2-dehydropantoate 2-reductase, partial [Gammaproteobacteria bacterium]
MKIAMMGSGGIGGYFGGRMAAAGHDVTFIARGAHLNAIRANGLAIDSRELDDALVKPAQATDNPAEVGPVDCVIVGVKLGDTEDAARAIQFLKSKAEEWNI